MAKKQYAFYVNSAACSGCKTCQIACKDKNDLEVGRLWRRVYEVTGGDWVQQGNAWQSNVFAYNLSIACNHCANPICMEVCPTASIQKRDDGIVYIEDENCVGCRYCEWACPYGAPQFNEEAGVMSKCNMCFDYVDEGKLPACVAACPLRALDFGEIGELQAKYGNSEHIHPVGEIHPLPESSITQPSLLINPHRDAMRADQALPGVANEEEV